MLFRDFIDSAPRGTAASLARALGVSPVMVVQWASGAKPIAPDRCGALERATDGKVTCEEMRPDVAWYRVPDVTWPHVQGRPLIDVTATAATAAAAGPQASQAEVRDAA